jgi:SAM-dependent methyltransferase
VGVTEATAEFLAEARAGGADFTSTLTIGKQASFAGPLRLGAILRRNGLWPAGDTRRTFCRRFRQGPPWLIDPYLRVLGATDLHALDLSGVEGADIVHDLDRPVPAELEQRFDLVLDGGSLEHVFDVRQALANYMRIVRVGGRVVIQTAANNHCGHGFYQFSPELFYRAFSEANGYRIERVHLVEGDVSFTRPLAGISFPLGVPRGRRFAVTDPLTAGERVLLRTRVGVWMLVEARRVASVAPLEGPVHQSDYEPARREPLPDAIPLAEAGPLRAAFRKLVPPEARMSLALDVAPRLGPLIDPLHRLRTARARSFANRRHYRRVDNTSA